MNRLKRTLMGALLASIISIAVAFPAMAARISFSDPSAEAGNEVTVNMKITGGENETINSSNVMLSYDPQFLQFLEGTGATGDAGSIRVVGEAQSSSSTELAFTLKFRALKPGSATITISTQEVYDKDGRTVNVGQEGKSTITITGEAVAENGAELSQLQISPGVLSPAFSPDVDTYTASVDGDTESVAVSALAADGSASVSVSGNEGLQMGENEILCTVTSADGQTARTYRILVTRGEGAGGEGAMAAQVSLRTNERVITVLSLEEDIEVPEGFIKCSVNIDGQAVRGWIWNDKENPNAQPEYCIFYAVNEDGEYGFYRYDLTEKTLQRYFRDPASGGELQDKYNATAEEYNSLLHDYEIRFWIIMGLIALSVVLLIVIIVLVAGRGQRDDFIERREDDAQWEAEKRSKRPKLSKEEQYLRDLEEEEEEAEREEDFAFVRRVQSGGERGYQTRQAAGQGPRTQTQTSLGGKRGTGPAVQGGQRSQVQPGVQTRGGQTGTVPGVQNVRPVSGVRGVQTGAPGGRTGGSMGTGRVSQVPGGAGQTRPGAGGRANPRGQSANMQEDDDFEVIDLE